MPDDDHLAIGMHVWMQKAFRIGTQRDYIGTIDAVESDTIVVSGQRIPRDRVERIEGDRVYLRPSVPADNSPPPTTLDDPEPASSELVTYTGRYRLRPFSVGPPPNRT